MRVKKQKRHRKIVRFYTACYGFRPPFKVLCDGTFVHHLLVNRITPADDALSNVLGSPVKLFTTSCVLAELKNLGRSVSESLDAAQQLLTARCNHENRKRADACILELISENNPEHFFVATQEYDLRKKSLEMPGVPVIYALRNALLLEPPSAIQRAFVKTSEEERSHMNEKEYEMLKKKMKSTLTNEEQNGAFNEGLVDQNLQVQAMTKTRTARKGIDIKDKVQFKRKKAKGPNPLSCLKKKNRENRNSVQVKEKNDENDSVRSRGRKRKRSRGHRKSGESEG
ncbi:hypothetical protein FNV43_RR03250 [Rhamnella rubrinervis]|uniref:UTP23 sensor motif region domain-containing protein n=1 Tax=Rhamnella rubrinervis TaxID=2594499 RepID=A0A8K0HHM8_9ROSA|nr:hypothetical protein FNV43_RR03250 [Rhamnella rubrinervis]